MKDKKSMEYVIPLKRIYWGRRSNRAARAIKYIRRFVMRHFGTPNVVIDQSVNEEVWKRGIEKPPRRIVVVVEKIDEDTARVTLAGKAREEG